MSKRILILTLVSCITLANTFAANPLKHENNLFTPAGCDVSVSQPSYTICVGTGATITVSGASTYVWSPSDGLNTTTGDQVIASPTTTTTYTVTGTDGVCVSTQTVVVNVDLYGTTLYVQSYDNNSNYCVGERKLLLATGADSYEWSPSIGLSSTSGSSVMVTIPVDSINGITYTVAGKTGACTYYSSYSLSPLDSASVAPLILLSPSISTICLGGKTQLTATDGFDNYDWIPNDNSSDNGISTIVGPTVTTTYYVHVVDPNNSCSNIASADIIVKPTATHTVTVTPSNVGIAKGSSINLVASGADTYEWSPATGLSSTLGTSVSASPSVTTEYVVTGTVGDCGNIANATVFIIPNTVQPIIAASLGHSLKICPDGTVHGVGQNNNGQLGDGTTTQRSTPVLMNGLTDIISVSAGGSHSLALKKDGTVWACGLNTNGQLGDGTTTQRLSPVQVVGLTGIIAISAGTSHSLALKNDGTVWAWGLNTNGRLGDGSTTQRLSPVQVHGINDIGYLTGIIEISAGSTHNLALKFDGTILAWGSNSSRQLGAGASAPSQSTYPIKSVFNDNQIGKGITSVSAGTLYSLALKNDGTVLSWGRNANGQLGRGNTSTSENNIMQVHGAGDVGLLNDVIKIAAGNGTSQALKNDGTVWAWGLNTSGQIGDGTTTQSTTPVQVHGVGNAGFLTNIISIIPKALGSHFIVLKKDGTALNWGLNANTQLGDGTTTNSTTPISITFCPPCNSLTVISSASAICSGGSVTITASGFNTYQWSPSAGLSSTTGSVVTASPTITTTYSVTGTSSGCSDTKTITVTVNPSPTVTANTSASSVCAGTSVTLTGSGANSYSWTGGISDGVGFVPTSTTTYTVTGTTVGGCSNTATITITLNSSPTITASASANTVCAGTSVTLTGGGASLYSWTGGVVDGVGFIPSATGTYTVTGTSAEGCSGAASITLTVNPIPTITISPSVTICQGTNATFIAGGANTYVWSPIGNSDEVNDSMLVAVNPSPLAPKTYTVVGTDLNGCSNFNTSSVTVIRINYSTSSSAVCNSYTLSVNSVDPYSFQWSPSAGLNVTTGNTVFANPTTTTDYIVTGIAAGFCSFSKTFNVQIISLPTITVTPTSAIICSGGSTTLTATGPSSSYNWSPSTGLNTTTGTEVIASPTTTTTYIVTRASGKCSDPQTVVVTVNPLPVVTANASASTVCTGTSVTLTGGGAISYSWTGGVIDGVGFVPTSTTTYTVTGTNAEGCSNTAAITITVNPLPIVTANSTANTVCAGTSVTLTGNGANSYSWTNGIVNGVGFIPTSTTTYTVIGTNVNGCKNSKSIVITVNPKPTIIISPMSASLCNGSSATLTASGALSYVWNTGATTASIKVTPNATTTYVVTGKNSSGCTNTQSVVVTVNPTIIITPVNPSICTGSSVILIASGVSAGGTYKWNTGSTSPSITVTPNTTTTYTVTGKNVGGCTNTQKTTVTVNPKPSISISPVNPSICRGSSVILTANGAGNGGTYQWSTGATTVSISVSPNATTAYSVIGTNSYGCTNTCSASVKVHSTPNVTVSPSSTTICNGKSVKLTASGAGNNGTYKWSTGANTKAITVTPPATTTYTVTGTNSRGCTNTAISKVTVISCKNSFDESDSIMVVKDHFNINPNPATANITIDLNLTVDSYGKIEIIDMLGNKVRAVKQGMLTTGKTEVNISDLPAGVYYIQVGMENNILTKKLIVY